MGLLLQVPLTPNTCCVHVFKLCACSVRAVCDTCRVCSNEVCRLEVGGAHAGLQAVHLHLVLLLSFAPCSAQSAATARWCARARPWEKEGAGQSVKLPVAAQVRKSVVMGTYVLSPGQQSVTCIFGFIATRLVPHFRALLQLVL